MSVAQLDHFREILHAWKRELMEEVDRTMHHMQDDSANCLTLPTVPRQEEEFSSPTAHRELTTAKAHRG